MLPVRSAYPHSSSTVLKTESRCIVESLNTDVAFVRVCAPAMIHNAVIFSQVACVADCDMASLHACTFHKLVHFPCLTSPRQDFPKRA